jgi:class 3 adenylate cyclase
LSRVARGSRPRGLFPHGGARTRRLLRFLGQREQAPPPHRPEMDCRNFPDLFQRRAVVFTDTADFTVRTLRHGILHFLMVFDRVARQAAETVRPAGGEVVKVEADSLMLTFPDVRRACRGVERIQALLTRLNRRLPGNERLRFAYGIGYGDVLELEDDVFGLEVNLASKIGEDLAEPGEALLTPAAAEALAGTPLGRRLRRHATVDFADRAFTVLRLPLASRARAR